MLFSQLLNSTELIREIFSDTTLVFVSVSFHFGVFVKFRKSSHSRENSGTPTLNQCFRFPFSAKYKSVVPHDCFDCRKTNFLNYSKEMP